MNSFPLISSNYLVPHFPFCYLNDDIKSLENELNIRTLDLLDISIFVQIDVLQV